MIKPRWANCAALVHNRFIIVVGGFLTLVVDPETEAPILTTQVSHCECYDTKADTWFEIDSIPPITTTHMSIVSFDDRYVFVLPSRKDTNYTFHRMDSGSELEYSTSNKAKLAIASKKWTSLKV